MWERFGIAKENGDDILILGLKTETALLVNKEQSLESKTNKAVCSFSQATQNFLDFMNF